MPHLPTASVPLSANSLLSVSAQTEEYRNGLKITKRHIPIIVILHIYYPFIPIPQITLDKTPELAQAAAKTIEKRLAAKDWEDTEWSRANMICFYARLKDSEKLYSSVKQLLGKLSRENMFTVSPAGIAGAGEDIFAFDGNTAGAAGMAEMLLQSHDNCIELLSCLPEEWKNGSFKGLCGVEVSK